MPTFRAVASGSGANTVNVTIPAGVQPGDSLLLVAWINQDGAITGPSGWAVASAPQQPEATGVKAALYKRIAQSGDAGSTVVITNDSGTGIKAGAILIAHSGTDLVDPVHALQSVLYTPTQSSHATPSVTTAIDDCIIIEIAVTKSSSTTTFSAIPAGATSRATLIGTGGGHADCAVADRGPVAAGNYGGGSFVQDAAASSSITYTIAIAPKTASQTLRPATDEVVDAGYTAVPPVGSGVPLASRIADPIRDDSTLIRTPNGPTGAVYECRLVAGLDPLSSTGHQIPVVLSTGGGATSSSCVVSLRQGTDTEITAQAFTDIPDTPTLYTLTVPPEDADTITNYQDLRIRFVWTVSG